MSVIGSNILAGASGQQGYNISRSVRLRGSASAYFNRTPASASNRKTWTWSGWIKRGALGSMSLFGAYTAANAYAGLYVDSNNNLAYQDRSSGVNNALLTTTQVFRDPSAWYHIVLQIDTTQATSTNRIRIYVNGTQVTAFSTTTYPSLNFDGFVNNNILHELGALTGGSFWDGYLTEVNFIDGQALTPSSFGETNTITGVWQPKKYTGTYGTNGFYLNFSNPSAATAAAIGADYSGNGNNWTPNNISVTAGVTYDSMLDVPTQWADGGNGRGNYATLNPLNNSGGVTISDGNLKALWASASDRSVLSTFPIPSTGKFYAEFVNGTLTSASVAVAFGLATEGSSRTGMIAANMWVYYASNQSYISRNGTLSSQIGTNQTIAAGGILQVAIDRDNNQAWLGYNNVWVNATNGTTGDPSAGTNPTVSSLPADLFVMVGLYAENGNVNFGQRPFAYTPPTGFKALNTLNLPQPTILKGNQYFDATVYTGSTGTNNIVNSGGMAPDLVWVKSRAQNYPHYLYDVVRGTGATALSSNNANVQGADGTSITSFNNNGFTFTGNSGANDPTFANGYIGWQWRAGVSAVTNTAGSITSTVDAGTTQGFSIVTYTGTGANATVGHGLGVAPSMIIFKNRQTVVNWAIWHNSFPTPTTGLIEFTTGAVLNSATYWNSTTPTSSVFSLGSYVGVNENTKTHVAYCFAPVAGFSAFGSYTGNGSADGTFVYLGFRPEFVMIKNATGTASANTGWYMFDTARNTFNVMANPLLAQVADAEQSGYAIDFLSNGFKLRMSDAGINSSAGATHIYMAFAETPFKNSLAR